MSKAKSYNHLFFVGFSVSQSEYDNPEDCLKHEKEKVMVSFFKRAGIIFADEWYPHEIEGSDTYEEDTAEINYLKETGMLPSGLNYTERGESDER